MVTFRFYLVSIVAFFLALAVGVVVGSVLDGQIADQLRDRLDGVETSLDETVAAMDDKNREIEQFERYVEESAPFAVQGELTEASALVVAEPGVDQAPVEDLVRRLRQGGAHVEGIVWLEPSWDLAESEQLTELAAISGSSGSSKGAVRRGVWSTLFDAQAEAGTGEPAGGESGTTTTTTTVPEGTTTTAPDEGSAPLELFADATLTELEQAGFVRFQEVDSPDGAGGGTLVVVAVTGTASTAESPSGPAIELAEEAGSAGVAAVLSEVFVAGEGDDAPVRGEDVAQQLGGRSLEFSVVDDLDLIAGRVATVLALSDAIEGTFGRFGYGPDVDGVLPQWQGP